MAKGPVKLDYTKTEMTIEHVQTLYQTLADIFGEEYGVDIKAVVTKKTE